MARIALIKVFAGMNLPVAQLAGDLVAHGHEVKVIFLKRQEQDLVGKKQGEYLDGDYTSHIFVMNQKRGLREFNWTRYKPFSDAEKGKLRRILDEFKPDAIGISTLSTGMTLALDAGRFLKQHYPVPLMMGGTGPTVEPERAITVADVVCVGEGEDFIVELAGRLDEGKPLHDIAGGWFKLPDGSVNKNPKRALCDLEDIAMPIWDDAVYEFVDEEFIDHPGSAWVNLNPAHYYIMTQRGCPFSCTFCIETQYQEMFGKKGSLRRRSPQKVLEELDYMVEHFPQIRGVMFNDDVFTLNPRWHAEFLPEYAKRIKLPFWCYTYPTTHTKELLQDMYDAGCRSVTMGVQSGSMRLLKEVYNRPTNRDRIIKAAEELADVFEYATIDLIPVTVFDEEQDLIDTFNLLLEIPYKLEVTAYNRMTYFPDYPITRIKESLKIADDQYRLSDHVYHYYLKLFNITRTDIPRERLVEISRDPEYKKNHNLLNPLLAKDTSLRDLLPV